MRRSLGQLLLLLALAFPSFAQTELPKRSGADDSFDIEPPLLIPNRDLEKPATSAKSDSSPAPADAEKLAKDFERAKRSAAGAARLCRMGAIAQVEAEQRLLRVARVQAELEKARMVAAKENFAREEARLASGEIKKADLAEADAALARAIEAAHAAEQNRQRAEVEFAENNVRRQQKLVALGSGRKSDVARAEQRLTDLKAAKEND